MNILSSVTKILPGPICLTLASSLVGCSASQTPSVAAAGTKTFSVQEVFDVAASVSPASRKASVLAFQNSTFNQWKDRLLPAVTNDRLMIGPVTISNMRDALYAAQASFDSLDQYYPNIGSAWTDHGLGDGSELDATAADFAADLGSLNAAPTSALNLLGGKDPVEKGIKGCKLLYDGYKRRKNDGKRGDTPEQQQEQARRRGSYPYNLRPRGGLQRCPSSRDLGLSRIMSTTLLPNLVVPTSSGNQPETLANVASVHSLATMMSSTSLGDLEGSVRSGTIYSTLMQNDDSSKPVTDVDSAQKPVHDEP